MSDPPPRLSSRPPRPASIPPGVPAPGHVIAGKYRVERLLGLGGMGVVLLARHLELDERVAIKMLLPSIAPRGEVVTRFVREARAAIKIRSAHVVRILDVARLDDGAPYIVMEYLEGSDLARVADERGPLAVEDAVEYVVQACEAIAAAHALGIVHRDLKPANLFLCRGNDGAPTIKVLDFGISKIAENDEGGSGLTSTTTIMGTPCFMSPEQLRSTRDVDARADIWSLGAILHALLVGAPPYDGESNADVSAKIIRDLPTPLRQLRPETPPEVEAIVLRCLEKEPSARYPDVVSLVQALAAVTARDAIKVSAARVVRSSLATGPTIASVAPPALTPSGPTRTASAWGETGREERRERTTTPKRLAIAGAVAVGLGLVAVGVVTLRGTPATPPPASAAASPPPAPPAASIATAAPDPVVPPSSTAPIVPAPSASTASVPSPTGKARPAGPGPRPPSRPGTTPSSAAAPPATGLFDGRE